MQNIALERALALNLVTPVAIFLDLSVTVSVRNCSINPSHGYTPYPHTTIAQSCFEL
jgi:hypothetical protein